VTNRLIFVSHAPTALTRRAAFPADVPIEAGQPKGELSRIVAAVSGPERRCVQTGRLFGLEPAVDPALRDWDHGTWAGHTLDEINITDPAGVAAWLADPSSTPGGGDSLLAVLGRVGAWLDGTAYPAGRVAVFTHPAIIRAAVVHALGAGPRSFWRIDVAPLSRTTLSGTPGRWTLSEIARAV